MFQILWTRAKGTDFGQINLVRGINLVIMGKNFDKKIRGPGVGLHVPYEHHTGETYTELRRTNIRPRRSLPMFVLP